jgi:hypothetical protein
VIVVKTDVIETVALMEGKELSKEFVGFTGF